ncbi:MAG: hypothetical protein PHO37_10385, partial [Kiritimatiellae bacterium]|nr:hypothetical protein [Kiritimatiellia bacterium]
LISYEERYLTPSLGCWTSRDRIGTRGGLKENGFIQNNCINDVDLLGRMANNINKYFTGEKSKYNIAKRMDVKVYCMPKRTFTGGRLIDATSTSAICDGGTIKVILIPRISVPPEIRPPLSNPGKKFFGGAYGEIDNLFNPDFNWETPSDFWGNPSTPSNETNGWGVYPIYTYPNAKFDAGIFISKLAEKGSGWSLEAFNDDLFKVWYKSSNSVPASQLNYSIGVSCRDKVSIQVGGNGYSNPMSRNQIIEIR